MEKQTKIVFMGTPDFAVAALEALNEMFTVVAVVTQPDRPAGRGQKLTPPPVKIAAQKMQLPVLQPQKINTQEFIAKLAALGPDYIVTAAFGRLLPPEILQIPHLAPLNIHASLLPAYRGAAPIQRAIMNGEKETGITIMLMDEGMDTGDIILQEAIPIGDFDTAGTLHDKLAELGAKLIIRAIKAINKGNFTRKKQVDSLATYAAPVQKKEAKICWNRDAVMIHNLVRSLNPWPGAYTELNGRRLKIWEGMPTADQGAPCGSVLAVEKDAIVVAAGKGAYRITKLQLQGKRAMDTGDFLRGYPIKTGTILGNPADI
ncbi:MAG: methionyl-tRNA formyltransferase [Firmicutes bacterium]|nr:methionyl-tRNA formyltransferase [Bacillota bacterium]